MNFDKWRFGVEITGIVALVGSLIFVGLQMRQDRQIAIADLVESRNELFVNRWTTGMQSDAYLTAWAKLYSTHDWDTGTLTQQEIAAAEIDAMMWWTYLEVTFRQHRLGLVDDDEWAVWENNVLFGVRWPLYRAVFKKFWGPTPNDYTRAVDDVLRRSHESSSQAPGGS